MRVLFLLPLFLGLASCTGHSPPAGSLGHDAEGASSANHQEAQVERQFSCPRPVILRELARQELQELGEEGAAAQLKAVISLERVAHVNCEVRKGGLWMQAVVRLSAAKGSAFPLHEKTVEGVYFLAAQDQRGQVVAKAEKSVRLAFDEEAEGYVGVIDAIELGQIEAYSQKDIQGLRFVLGLQFTPSFLKQ